MRGLIVSVLFLLLSVLQFGCGGGDSSPGEAASASEPQPMEGKELGKASQLVGTWLGTTDGDYVGFEFMKENKVLVTHALQSAMTGMNSGMMMTFDVIEGGRLALSNPSGQTQIYTATIKGDKLELKGQMMFADTDFQQFRRLASGQTLEQAVLEKEKADAQAARARYDAVTGFLKQPGLVIVSTTPGPGAPVSVAIAPSDGTGRQTAWHDDVPPHLDEISVSASIADNGRTAFANVVFGKQLQPPPTQQSYGGGNIPFEIGGSEKNPTAIAKVSRGGANYELQLKRDEKLYEQIVGRFEDELKRVEAMRQPLIKALKDFAILEGESGSERTNQGPDKTRISLVRDENTGDYSGDGILIQNGRPTPLANTTAQVTVVNNAAMLIVTSYNRNYQLTLDEATGRLTGGWFYGNSPNGFQVNLEITLAEDAAARAKRLETLRKAWESIDPGEPFIGLIDHTITWLSKPAGISLILTPPTNSQVTGAISFPTASTTMDMQGQLVETVSGPQLQLRFGSARPGSTSPHTGALANSLRNQVWAFTLVESSIDKGPLQLTNGAQTLTQTNASAAADLRKRLASALAAGMQVAVHTPANPGNTPPLTFQLKTDGNGKLAGSAISGSMLRGFNPESTLEGEIQESGNLPLLALKVFDPPPARAGAFHRIYGSELLAYPTLDGWLFTGRFWPETNKMSLGYLDLLEVR